MPPRYAYWTILVDNQATAFRAGAKDDLLPTFNRLKEKNPSAVMMWFQNGKLWPSRVDAQEAMLARGEMGRRGDARQGGGGFRERHKVGARSGAPQRERGDRPERSDRGERPEWKPKTHDSGPKTHDSRPKTQDSRPKSSRPSTFAKAPVDKQDLKTSDKLDWKPKGTFTPAPKRADRSERPRAFDRDRKPEWKPKGPFDRDRKPEWRARTQDSRPRTSRSEKPEWKPKGSFDRDRKPEWRPRSSDRSVKPEWKPKTSSPQDLKTAEKRKWIPKEEYKKSQGIEAKRDAKWRPGGEHRDPRQKYKDAKKAKWSKFKKNIRQKWESKTKKKS
jgi:hypothetical protein